MRDATRFFLLHLRFNSTALHSSFLWIELKAFVFSFNYWSNLIHMECIIGILHFSFTSQNCDAKFHFDSTNCCWQRQQKKPIWRFFSFNFLLGWWAGHWSKHGQGPSNRNHQDPKISRRVMKPNNPVTKSSPLASAQCINHLAWNSIFYWIDLVLTWTCYFHIFVPFKWISFSYFRQLQILCIANHSIETWSGWRNVGHDSDLLWVQGSNIWVCRNSCLIRFKLNSF